MNVFVLCAAVVMTVPMHSMENADIATEEIAEQKPTTVWYKKRSVKIAAVLTIATAICACAMYTNKISAPEILVGLFSAKLVNDITPHSDNSGSADQTPVQDDKNEQTVVEENKVATETTPQEVTIEKEAATEKKTVSRWELTQQTFNKYIHKISRNAQRIQTEDFKKMSYHQI